MIELTKIDRNAGLILSNSLLFEIYGKFYNGLNFDFSALKCNASVNFENELYFLDFKPITNKKSFNKLKRAMKSKRSTTIENHTSAFKEKSNGIILNLIQCARKEHTDLLFRQQRFIAAFFLFNCESAYSVLDVTFCKEQVNQKVTPVFLNIIKLLNE